jgi:hypothetical protein
MPGSASDVVEADLLKLLTGQATTIFTSTPLAHIYIGLDSKGSWAAPTGTSPCQTSNSAALTFPTATGAWASSAPIKSFLAFDASTGGNFLFGGDLTDITKTVTTAGDTISFPIGSLIGQLD